MQTFRQAEVRNLDRLTTLEGVYATPNSGTYFFTGADRLFRREISDGKRNFEFSTENGNLKNGKIENSVGDGKTENSVWPQMSAQSSRTEC